MPNSDGARPRRPTLNDVAARAGVSRALASLVIRRAPGPSEESRARVLQAADELGYRPDPSAQVLRSHRSRLLGVTLTVHDTFHADLVEAIYPAAAALGYEVLLTAVTPTRAEDEAIDALTASRCEGLILLGSVATPARLRELGATLPVVVLGRGAGGGKAAVDTVRTVDAAGLGRAVDHLVGLGHRRIVHVDAGRDAGAAERRRGYRDAMRLHGLDDLARIVPGRYTEQAGGDAARVLLDEPALPTAIVAANDRCAVGVLDAFLRAGVRVPQDVSVVGFDDSQLARLHHIDLTTVRQDAARMASLAVGAAAERLDDGRTDARDITLDPELVVRGTTAPPVTRRRAT
ncbi:MAG: hypothetical protein QOJ30_4011 [Pseudonocardiales bacterium]|nr:hypothetical protein [Pseudonocardiales bacterium]